MIYRIDPTDTPFMSGVEKEKATAVNHEWQTQALAAASSANAQLEGDDPTTTATTPTVRLGNLCQISYKVAQVSGTQQAVDHAGRDNELAYQEMLKGLELKRDIETILVGTNQAKVTGNTTTPRQTASILSWIASNTSKGTAGSPADPAPVDGTGTRTDGTPDRVHRGAAEKRAVLDLDQRRQARHHHDRRLQQAGVLDLHRPRHRDRGSQVEEDRGLGRRLRVGFRQAQGGGQPLPACRATCWCWKWTSGRWPISTAAT